MVHRSERRFNNGSRGRLEGDRTGSGLDCPFVMAPPVLYHLPVIVFIRLVTVSQNRFVHFVLQGLPQLPTRSIVEPLSQRSPRELLSSTLKFNRDILLLMTYPSKKIWGFQFFSVRIPRDTS